MTDHDHIDDTGAEPSLPWQLDHDPEADALDAPPAETLRGDAPCP